jgi:pyruvate,water dikinase
MISTSSLVLRFRDIDKTKHNLVGGKGANLGELSRIEGIRVPDGFCITTEAFKRIMAATPLMARCWNNYRC